MKYEAIYQLHFWNNTVIPYKRMMLWEFQPSPTLEESANGLRVPVSNPIPLSSLDQAGGDFHSLYRQGP